MADRGRPFWDEYQNSVWSKIENPLTYKEFEAIFIKADSKRELAKAKKAAADARNVLKRARKAIAGSE